MPKPTPHLLVKGGGPPGLRGILGLKPELRLLLNPRFIGPLESPSPRPEKPPSLPPKPPKLPGPPILGENPPPEARPGLGNPPGGGLGSSAGRGGPSLSISRSKTIPGKLKNC